MNNRSNFAISLITGLLLVYIVASTLPIYYGLIFFLFLLTSVGLLWMVYRILTDVENYNQRKFDDYFYQDVEIKKNKEVLADTQKN
jgi:high-affinity Fe2+/Pb2+ permease